MTLDMLAVESKALRCFLEQKERIEAEAGPDRFAIARLTGDDSGPATYDLVAIWRASLDDPDCRHMFQGRAKTSPQARRYFSPRRYVNAWSHEIDVLSEPGDGRILVDHDAAIGYVIRADLRVCKAVCDKMASDNKAQRQADPIGNAVRVAQGGGFAMIFARVHALQHLGLTNEAFDKAVMERAKEEAESLDDYAAETLLSKVRQALEAGPRVQMIA